MEKCFKERFLWKDVIACRNNKISLHTGETEEFVRKKLEHPYLKNPNEMFSCPKCGNKFDKLELFWFESPIYTWSALSSWAGWILVCIKCKKQIFYACDWIS